MSATDVKIEFDANMKCQDCGNKVTQALKKLGVKNYLVDVPQQSVIVTSSIPFTQILAAINKAGVQAVMKGSEGEAAVAEMAGEGILGVVRFQQVNRSTCIIDGTMDGLSPGEHGLHIHQYGDFSNSFKNLGPHFNGGMSCQEHGGRSDIKRHYGDLGNITADEKRRATFRIEDSLVKVYDIIGRSLAVSELRDDLGQGHNSQSKLDGNCGETIAAAIIARSAGLFQNPKRLCLCDGVSIWEEKDSPSASKSRTSSETNPKIG